MRSNPCYGAWTPADQDERIPADVDKQATEQDEVNVYEEPRRARKEEDRVTKGEMPVLATSSSNDLPLYTETSRRSPPVKADRGIPYSGRKCAVAVFLLLIAVAVTFGITSLILHLKGSGKDSFTPGNLKVSLPPPPTVISPFSLSLSLSLSLSFSPSLSPSLSLSPSIE